MLERFKEELAKLSRISREEVWSKIVSVRREIKKLRVAKSIPNTEVLTWSQKLLSESLNVDLELVKKSIARTVLRIGRTVVLKSTCQALKAIKNLGLTVICIGNVMFWPSSYTRLILEKYRVSNYIDFQFYSDETGYYKPMREAFIKPLNMLSCKPEEAVHIGDSLEEDYFGALNSGLKAILISKRGETNYELERGFIVKSIGEIPEIVENMVV